MIDPNKAVEIIFDKVPEQTIPYKDMTRKEKQVLAQVLEWQGTKLFDCSKNELIDCIVHMTEQVVIAKDVRELMLSAMRSALPLLDAASLAYQSFTKFLEQYSVPEEKSGLVMTEIPEGDPNA